MRVPTSDTRVRTSNTRAHTSDTRVRKSNMQVPTSYTRVATYEKNRISQQTNIQVHSSHYLDPITLILTLKPTLKHASVICWRHGGMKTPYLT